MTFHDSKVGKLGKVSKSNPPTLPPSAKAIFGPKESGPGPSTPVKDPVPELDPITCCWRWSSKNADVSSVGKQPGPGNRLQGLWGSGFRIGTSGACALPNLTPVTCCTICRKLAGSAVMKVVWDFLEARDFRFETLPPAGGIGFRWRFGAVSGSEPPERPETVGVVGAVSGLMRLSKGETVSVCRMSKLAPEIDFWIALVSVSVSRENTSEIHESAKAGRKGQASMLAKFSDDAIA